MNGIVCDFEISIRKSAFRDTMFNDSLIYCKTLQNDFTELEWFLSYTLAEYNKLCITIPCCVCLFTTVQLYKLKTKWSNLEQSNYIRPSRSSFVY